MPYAQAFLTNHNSPTNGNELLTNAREIITDRLYFTSIPFHPPQFTDIHFFSVDSTLVYCNFYADFGPNNLAHVFRFCQILQDKFQNPITSSKKIVLYSGIEPDKRANAAFLITAYMMIVQKYSPDQAYQPFVGISPAFVPYRDAGYGMATYHITVLDAVKGLYKALTLGLLDIDAIDIEDYEFYEKVENGDLNWITNKFVALANPKDDYPPNFRPQTSSNSRFYSVYRIPELLKWFKERKIKTIIRLNNKIYDQNKFVEAGIEHIDLYFPDGTNPPEGILLKFLEICETRSGPIAVHCRAGLGRTGTLIAAYLMKHYKLTACEVISFLRVVRPGSVVGPQQNFLQSMQAKLLKMHPSSPLAPSISCLTPPTYYTSTRFGLPFGPFFDINSKQGKRSSIGANSSDIKNISGKWRDKSSIDDRMDIDELIQRDIKSRGSLTAVNIDFDQSPNTGLDESNLTYQLNQMMIPVQPRKSLTSTKQREPTPLQNNLSEFKTPNSRPSTAGPQSHSPSVLINELYTTNRYNLRSAISRKQETPDQRNMQILGSAVKVSDVSKSGKNALNSNK